MPVTGDTAVTRYVTAMEDVLLLSAWVEAEGLREFRKRLDQSCRLDPPVVSQCDGLDAACCSGTHNLGKTAPVLPHPPTKFGSAGTSAGLHTVLGQGSDHHLPAPRAGQGRASMERSCRRRDACSRAQTGEVPGSNTEMQTNKGTA